MKEIRIKNNIFKMRRRKPSRLGVECRRSFKKEEEMEDVLSAHSFLIFSVK